MGECAYKEAADPDKADIVDHRALIEIGAVAGDGGVDDQNEEAACSVISAADEVEVGDAAEEGVVIEEAEVEIGAGASVAVVQLVLEADVALIGLDS
jgi:hypothetical protein